MHLLCQLTVSKYCESFLMPSVWELESPSQACSSDGFCLFAFLLTFQEQINTLFPVPSEVGKSQKSVPSCLGQSGQWARRVYWQLKWYLPQKEAAAETRAGR